MQRQFSWITQNSVFIRYKIWKKDQEDRFEIDLQVLSATDSRSYFVTCMYYVELLE